MNNRSPHFPLILILAACALLALACNLSRSKSAGLHLDSRANDGSISGTYQYSQDMGSKPILFSVSPDGQAVFQVKGAPKSADLTVDFSTQDVPSMSWQSSTLDGLGVLSGEEERLLNNLWESDLSYALAMIPMDLACQGEENIDPIQLAALLFPLQMRFKYQITDRAGFASNLVALSQCNYEQEISDDGKAGSPSKISISASSPVPVVIGYFPFDEAGAFETASTDGNQAKMACLDKESKPIISNFGPNTTFLDDKVFDDEPFQNEWGPCDAKCRGACGPDCTYNNCKHSIEERCEKNQEGENDGFFSLVHVYDCGLHPACVKHDACYDDCNRRHGCDTWAASVCMHAGVFDPTVPWVSIFGLNISCDKATLNEEELSNVKDWVRGFGPQPERQIYEYYDKTVSFEYDPVTCPFGEVDETAASTDLDPATLTTDDETPESQATTSLVWVRQDEPIININNDPERSDYGEDPRRQESFTEWDVSETSFSSRHRYQEDDNFWYDVTFECTFDSPPIVLNPGTSHELKASFRHTGETVHDYEGLGELFEYNIKVGPAGSLNVPDVGDTLAYFPWSDYYDGIDTAVWVLEAPPAASLGDSFELYATLWNCPPCNVTWTYTVEEN